MGHSWLLAPVVLLAILALFKRLNPSRGIAILYTSHDLASVASLCDRVAILHDGEIVECEQLIGAIPRLPNVRAPYPSVAAR